SIARTFLSAGSMISNSDRRRVIGWLLLGSVGWAMTLGSGLHFFSSSSDRCHCCAWNESTRTSESRGSSPLRDCDCGECGFEDSTPVDPATVRSVGEDGCLLCQFAAMVKWTSPDVDNPDLSVAVRGGACLRDPHHTLLFPPGLAHPRGPPSLS
ncbi:MAG TPA: hypothetical protein VIY86_07685, partial [Pirellulaceae bacterium]